MFYVTCFKSNRYAITKYSYKYTVENLVSSHLSNSLYNKSYRNFAFFQPFIHKVLYKLMRVVDNTLYHRLMISGTYGAFGLGISPYTSRNFNIFVFTIQIFDTCFQIRSESGIPRQDRHCWPIRIRLKTLLMLRISWFENIIPVPPMQ